MELSKKQIAAEHVNATKDVESGLSTVTNALYDVHNANIEVSNSVDALSKALGDSVCAGLYDGLREFLFGSDAAHYGEMGDKVSLIEGFRANLPALAQELGTRFALGAMQGVQQFEQQRLLAEKKELAALKGGQQ